MNDSTFRNLKLLIEEYNNARRTRSDESQERSVEPSHSKKLVILEKYITDVNSLLEDLVTTLDDASSTITNNSYNETFNRLKKEADTSKAMLTTLAPMLSLYTLT